MLTLADGTTYSGTFKNGKADGYGIKTGCDGKIIHDGIWEKDKFVKNKEVPATTEEVEAATTTADSSEQEQTTVKVPQS